MSYGRSKIKWLVELKPEDWASYDVEPNFNSPIERDEIEKSVKAKEVKRLELKEVERLEAKDFQVKPKKFISMVEFLRKEKRISIARAYQEVVDILGESGFRLPYANLNSYTASSTSLRKSVQGSHCNLNVNESDIQISLETFAALVGYHIEVNCLNGESAFKKAVKDLRSLGYDSPYSSFLSWSCSKTKKLLLNT